MLAVARWTVQRGYRELVCTPPEGPERGRIAIRERDRPLAPLRALLDQRLESLRAEGASAIVVEPAAHVVTIEGELAALVTITSTLGEHTLGVIYGDDFQTVCDGRTSDPEQRAAVRSAVRELVVHLPLGLGRQRYRRFWYRPPIGWQGLVRGLVTDWYPADYPRTLATIKVHPARPYRMSPSAAQLELRMRDDQFPGFVPDTPLAHKQVQLGTFEGVVSRAVGQFPDARRRVFMTAALHDASYLYVMRLESGSDDVAAHEQQFLDLVASCVPVPSPSDPASTALLHWAE